MSLRIRIKAPSSEKAIAKIRQGLHSSEFLQKIQSEVVEGQIKRLIRSGQSPIEGFGRFVQYKDKDSYPAGEKPATPANLTLTGGMLRLYTATKKSALSILVGISDSASEKVKARAQGNNEGTLGLAGKKLNKAARNRIREQNLPLAVAARGKKKRSLQDVARSNSGIPARRFVPLKGENFTVSVIRALKNLYAKQVKSLLSKG